MSREGERLHFADATIRIDSMPAVGRDLSITLDDDERAELATQLGITAVEAIDVRLHAAKFRGGIRVTGRLTARIEQPSVVTLEPVHQSIDEEIDRVFLPTGQKAYADTAEAEIFVDPDGEDFPDHFDGPEADLSDLIIETVALAIDPYPRAPGESVADVVPADADAPESPFAALKALKDKGPQR